MELSLYGGSSIIVCFRIDVCVMAGVSGFRAIHRGTSQAPLFVYGRYKMPMFYRSGDSEVLATMTISRVCTNVGAPTKQRYQPSNNIFLVPKFLGVMHLAWHLYLRIYLDILRLNNVASILRKMRPIQIASIDLSNSELRLMSP